MDGLPSRPLVHKLWTITCIRMVGKLIFSVDQIKWMDTKEQQEFVSRLYNEEDSKLTAEFEKEKGLLYNHLRRRTTSWQLFRLSFE